MTVEYVCENCQKDNLKELSQPENKLVCTHCGRAVNIRLSQNMQTGGKVDRCVLCDKIRFYVQKDFNPRLGLLIFGIGVVFSYHTYGLTLLIATVIDFILYKVLKTVTICYHCRAIYRGLEEDPTHRGFDHNLALSLVEKEQKEKMAAAAEVSIP
jgi:DNA-directed RNA polymerase subunit RPC12/RpoP